MKFRSLLTADLEVNPFNDRHGELRDETTAIAWLFREREEHMKALAIDIASEGEVFEPPLVHQTDQRFRVFDGNRRVTCTKLLLEPSLAPSIRLSRVFEQIGKTSDLAKLTHLTCRVEDDLDRIDEILFRRHTGSQGGVGQSKWDDRMKRNFEARTGKGRGATVADAIEKFLAIKDALPQVRSIPRSTLNRLLSSEHFRNRVGVTFVSGSMSLTHTEDSVTVALKRISQDLAARTVVLGDLWDSKRKDAYLDTLDAEGVLPGAADQVPMRAKIAPRKRDKPSVEPKRTRRPRRRRTLIPQDELSVKWNPRLHRHRSIWEELQFHLNLDNHPNAVSVLLRVLLELTIDHAIKTLRLEQKVATKKLSIKIQKVAGKLKEMGLINQKYAQTLERLSQPNSLASIPNLNSYVHSYDQAPVPKDLTAIWDTVSLLIITCLNLEPMD